MKEDRTGRHFFILGSSFLILLLFLASTRDRKKGSDDLMALTCRGLVTEAEVRKCYFQRIASSGWKIEYVFFVKDHPYAGSAQGPRRYYGSAKPGDTVKVVYDPADPRRNCEIRYLVQEPSIRRIHEKLKDPTAKKRVSDLRKIAGFQKYSFNQWYAEQREGG